MNATIDSKKTGIRIKELMIKNGISATELQKKVALNCVQTIYQWMRGDAIPNVDNLFALSCALDVKMDDIIRGYRNEDNIYIKTIVKSICNYYRDYTNLTNK